MAEVSAAIDSDSSACPGATHLFFKHSEAAFEYACEYMDCVLREDAFLPAIVADAGRLFGISTPVKVQAEGVQIAALRVASADFGFLPEKTVQQLLDAEPAPDPTN